MKTQISIQYIFITLAVVLFTWLLHEFSHWFMGVLLGYDMAFTLNSAYPIQGSYDEQWHQNLISAAGPFVTLAQAIICFFLLVRRPVYKLFPFLFVPFYMRLLASGMNFINLNDEGRISHDMGIGTFTIPLVVTSVLFLLVLIISRKWALSKKFIIWTTVLVMLFSSVIILADQAYGLRIL